MHRQLKHRLSETMIDGLDALKSGYMAQANTVKALQKRGLVNDTTLDLTEEGYLTWAEWSAEYESPIHPDCSEADLPLHPSALLVAAVRMRMWSCGGHNRAARRDARAAAMEQRALDILFAA